LALSGGAIGLVPISLSVLRDTSDALGIAILLASLTISIGAFQLFAHHVRIGCVGTAEK
jgi:hypothetical protein